MTWEKGGSVGRGSGTPGAGPAISVREPGSETAPGRGRPRRRSKQFLDIGTGLPTQDNVHQIAQRVTPDARVVYVDNDPVALTRPLRSVRIAKWWM